MPNSIAHHSRLRSSIALPSKQSHGEIDFRSNSTFSFPDTFWSRYHPLEQPNQGELLSLQEKQRWLQSRLAAMLQQQTRETLARGATTPSLRMVPDSLEMIIYGLREELARVEKHIGSFSE